MTHLYLVRHGQASFGADDYDKLSEVGHQQSRWLGEYLAERGVRPGLVMTGSLRRHRETWEGMAAGLAAHGVTFPAALVRPGLDEYDSEQLLSAHAAAQARETARADPASAVATVPGHVGIAGDPADPEVRRAHFRLLRTVLTQWAAGTLEVGAHRTWQQFRQGALAALLEAWQGPGSADRDRDIVVVSSGGPIAAILVGLLDIPPAGFVALNLQARNTGYTEFLGNGRHPNLASFNGISHLDTPQRRSHITWS